MTELTLTAPERERLTAAGRFDAIRNLLREAERMRLTACALLVDADRHRDWEQLGLDNFTEYAEQLGIPQSTASKMLHAGSVFSLNTDAPAWQALPDADQAELTVDRLYEASLMVDAGRWTPEEALHEAVANSSDKLRDIRKGRESFSTHRCICPHCNNEHFAPNTAVDPGADVPF